MSFGTSWLSAVYWPSTLMRPMLKRRSTLNCKAMESNTVNFSFEEGFVLNNLECIKKVYCFCICSSMIDLRTFGEAIDYRTLIDVNVVRTYSLQFT